MTLVPIGAVKLGLEETNWQGGGSNLLDGAGEKSAAVLYVTQTDTIERVLMRTAAASTPQPLRVGLETVDAAGDPTGTQYGGSAPGVLASVTANTTYEVTLATPAACVIKDRVALVVQFDGAIGSVQVALCARTVGNFRGIPYSTHLTASWFHSLSAAPYGGLRYSTYGYQPVGLIPGNGTALNVNTGTTPNEIGNQWTPPFACAISGAWFVVDADGNFDVTLYDSDLSTVLDQVSHPATNRGATAVTFFEVPFTEQVLTVGQPYGLAIKPTSATNVQMQRCTVLAPEQLGALWLGPALYEIQRVGAGSWTHNTSQRVMIGPILSKLDDGTGAGGATGGPVPALRRVGWGTPRLPVQYGR